MLRNIKSPEGFSEAVLVILSPETPRMILMEVEKPVMLHYTPGEGNGVTHATPMGHTMSVRIYVRIGLGGILDIVRYVINGEEEEKIVQRCSSYNGRYLIEWADGACPAICSEENGDRIQSSLVDDFEILHGSRVQPDVAQGVCP